MQADYWQTDYCFHPRYFSSAIYFPEISGIDIFHYSGPHCQDEKTKVEINCSASGLTSGFAI